MVLLFSYDFIFYVQILFYLQEKSQGCHRRRRISERSR